MKNLAKVIYFPKYLQADDESIWPKLFKTPTGRKATLVFSLFSSFFYYWPYIRNIMIFKRYHCF